MKTHRYHHSRRGFTLVELLVVVSIIIVLAAMSYPVIGNVIRKQKMLETQSHAVALSGAIEQFLQTYGSLPNVGSQDELTAEGEAGTKLLTILLGKEEPGSDVQNTKGIVFLTAKISDSRKKGGLVYNGKQVEGFFDAWGRPLNIRLDKDLDQEIENPIKQGDVVRQKNVIVWSFGADGKFGDNDEVKSW